MVVGKYKVRDRINGARDDIDRNRFPGSRLFSNGRYVTSCRGDGRKIRNGFFYVSSIFRNVGARIRPSAPLAGVRAYRKRFKRNDNRLRHFREPERQYDGIVTHAHACRRRPRSLGGRDKFRGRVRKKLYIPSLSLVYVHLYVYIYIYNLIKAEFLFSFVKTHTRARRNIITFNPKEFGETRILIIKKNYIYICMLLNCVKVVVPDKERERERMSF